MAQTRGGQNQDENDRKSNMPKKWKTPDWKKGPSARDKAHEKLTDKLFRKKGE